MALSNTNPNTSTPPTLSPDQTRALLHTLLSMTPNARRSPAAPPRPAPIKPARQQPIQQTITIDASTRIMGHCNNVGLASPSSPMEQALTIKESLRGVLFPQPIGGQGEDKATANANANVNLNVIVQAGVNIMGSKNIVIFNGKRDVSKDDAKCDAPVAERKRRAESEPGDFQSTLPKKVKVEE